eukprot:scaffold1741_cov102-Isochrysis_galbana.AAC.5
MRGGGGVPRRPCLAWSLQSVSSRVRSSRTAVVCVVNIDCVLHAGANAYVMHAACACSDGDSGALLRARSLSPTGQT